MSGKRPMPRPSSSGNLHQNRRPATNAGVSSKHGSKKYEDSLEADFDDFSLEAKDDNNFEISSDGQVKREIRKVEMTKLCVSMDNQELMREALESIRGKPFKHRESSSYVDRGENLARRYWMEDRRLQVFGVTRAKRTDDLSPEELSRNFAIKQLERYGYHKSYCEDVISSNDGDVGSALETLFYNCFGNPRGTLQLDESDELITTAKEHRLEEKFALESIYGDAVFSEVITDYLWTVSLQPELLLKFTAAKSGTKLSLVLEIRFPKGSLYPQEAPIVHVYVKAEESQENAILPAFCLNVTGRLVGESRELAQSGSPCLFSLISLLENDDELKSLFALPPSRYSLEPAVEQSSDSATDSRLLGNDLPGMRNLREQGDSARSDLRQMKRANANLKRSFEEKSSSEVYKKMMDYRGSLPAWNYREKIVSSISKAGVVVVSGMTGCGKSTQVPQFLLDEFLGSDQIDHRYIICTQPRRISAVAVAQRVAEERNEKVGNVVGYQIRLESVMSKSTRLQFCTTGVLLRCLEGDPSMDHVTHIIVDEVHERSEESDFLLLALRDVRKQRPDLRIILMSATLNSNLFSNYFSGAPVIEIPGRTFPVEQYFLEHIIDKTNYILEEGSPYCVARDMNSGRSLRKELFQGGAYRDCLGNDEWLMMKERSGEEGFTPAKDSVKDENLTLRQVAHRYQTCSDRVQRTLAFMNHEDINYDLIESLIVWILNEEHGYPQEGSILVFLPGMAEISTLYNQLCYNPVTNPQAGKCILVPLHSSLTSEEQRLIFMKTKPGVRKIVLATNLAETSITIDDCVFVIDSGRMKENRYDPDKQMESLETVWVSVANALQRRGRAGRVRPGYCFHLFTSHRYSHQLAQQPKPEIQRVSLERIVLRCKVLPLYKDLQTELVLQKLLEPPAKETVAEAMERLQHLGALNPHKNLTPLGTHLAALPVDLRVGKLLLFGSMFCCVDSALTIAAYLSYKSPFVAPFKLRDEARKKKQEWSAQNSDHLTVLKAFKAWQGSCSRSRRAGEVFADENFLSTKTLDMLCSMKQHFAELLSSIGFLPAGLSRLAVQKMGSFNRTDGVALATGAKLNENGDNRSLLLSILCASLYPNIVRILRPEQRYSKSGAGAVPADPRPEQLRFLDRSDGLVFIHPSSVLHKSGNFETPYVVFSEKMKTSRVFIRECSMVPAFPLTLFGGSEINVSLHRGIFVLDIDQGWIKFVCDSHHVGELLSALRSELNVLLADKIVNPQLDLYGDRRGALLLPLVVKLITSPFSLTS